MQNRSQMIIGFRKIGIPHARNPFSPSIQTVPAVPAVPFPLPLPPFFRENSRLSLLSCALCRVGVWFPYCAPLRPAPQQQETTYVRHLRLQLA